MTGPKLKIVQIGSGSMGMRRLRDLSGRRDVELALFDSREDRRQRVKDQFGIPVFDQLEAAMDEFSPQAMTISTPPDQHDQYVQLALDRGLHHFCEADIWPSLLNKVEQASKKGSVVCAPSNSLHFLPIVEELKSLVRGQLGHLHGYQMALSTCVSNWHPGEGMEYYARHRDTSAGREMVPFELLWLNEVFGTPRQVSGLITCGGKSPGLREDTWSLQMRLENGAAGQLQVLMSPPTILRCGSCFGDAGQARFDLLSGKLWRQLRNPDIDDCRDFGALKDVLEQAYRCETDAFVDASLGRAEWPHSYHASAMATATLAAAERSATTGTVQSVQEEVQPEHLR